MWQTAQYPNKLYSPPHAASDTMQGEKPYLTRRGTLKTGALVGLTGLSGCIGDNDDGTDDGGDQDSDDDSSDDDESYPNQGVTLFSPSGLPENLFFGFQPYLEDELDASTTVDTREGAAGRVMINHVIDQEPDGYSLGFNPLHAILIGDIVTGDFSIDDIQFLGSYITSYFGWVTNEEYDDLDAFLEAAMNEGLDIGLGEPNSNAHFGGVNALDAMGVDITEQNLIPLGFTPDIVGGVARGDVDAGWAGMNQPSLELAQEEDLNIIFINRPEADPRLPDVPTDEDLDHDILTVDFTGSFFGPAGLSEEVMSTFEDAIVAATDNEEYQDWVVEEQGMALSRITREEIENEIPEIVDQLEVYRDLMDQI